MVERLGHVALSTLQNIGQAVCHICELLFLDSRKGVSYFGRSSRELLTNHANTMGS